MSAYDAYLLSGPGGPDDLADCPICEDRRRCGEEPETCEHTDGDVFEWGREQEGDAAGA